MTTLLQDVSYGVRMLVKHRGLTMVAVLTLALGIGANTTIFSFVNAVLLRPLPFADSDQLVLAYTRTNKIPRDFVPYPDLQDWRQQSQLFSSLSGFAVQSVNLNIRPFPLRTVLH